MAEIKTFRREARAWIRENAPRSLWGTSAAGPFDGFWGGRKHPAVADDVLRWRDRACEKGWSAPDWPRAYGGGGLPKELGRIIHDEMRAIGVPRPVAGQGIAMLGPVLLAYGSEEQKQSHLPPIVRGELRWCQGYSEPNAGSDLANVQLEAERDGEHWILNGQKVWTSHAHLADWIYCLVRSDPNAPKKQAGISFLLVDMETPGLTVRRIDLISGFSPFCETFFDDVRVPGVNLVGQPHQGWGIAKALLAHERSAIGHSVVRQRGSAQRELVLRARKHLVAPTGTLPEPLLRDEIAALGMREEALHLTLARIRRGAQDVSTGHEGSISKIVATELKQWRFEVGMRIAGPEGLGWEGPGFDEEDLQYTRDWLRSRANTIEGGSSEIQLNIIAKRLLGLSDGNR